MRRFQILVFAGILITGTPVDAADSKKIGRYHERMLFERMRALESESHRERIRILEEADKCIRQASDIRSYRNCEHEERNARQALNTRIAPRRASLKTELTELRERGGMH